MRLAVLLSGGKDSIFSLYKMLREGNEIKYLVTIFPESSESWMFHHPCIELTRLQAKALGIKQIVQKTKGEKEKELEDLKRALAKIKDEIEGVVSGTVASNYQKERIEKVCAQLGLKSFSPLWSKNPEELWKEEICAGFEIIITSVSTAGLDQSWLGKKIDLNVIEELKKLHEKYGLHLSFEDGGAETFVLDAPIFENRIQISEINKIWDSKTNSGYLVVESAKLISK